MPDWKKRVLKDRSGDLQADEELVDACFFQGRGTLSAMLDFAVKHHYAEGNAIDEQAASVSRDKVKQLNLDKNFAPEGSLASKVPDDKGVIAITTQRLIVFGYKQGIFKTAVEAPTLAVSRQSIVDWQYQSGKATSLMGMQFDDESSVAIELPRLNKPDDFARAIGIPFVEGE